MIVQSLVEFILAVTIGIKIGLFVIEGSSPAEQRCHFHIIGLKISLAAKRMILFCGGLTSV
jgi:hypothetical protein